MKLTLEQVHNYPDSLSLELVSIYRFPILGRTHELLSESEITDRAFVSEKRALANHEIGRELYSSSNTYRRNLAEIVTVHSQGIDFEMEYRRDWIIIYAMLKRFMEAQHREHAQYGSRPTQVQLNDYDAITNLINYANEFIGVLEDEGYDVDNSKVIILNFLNLV